MIAARLSHNRPRSHEGSSRSGPGNGRSGTPSALAAIVPAARAMVLLAACLLAGGNASAQGRWVLRQMSTSIDTTDKDVHREVPWNKYNRLVERRSDGVLATESVAGRSKGTLEVDPVKCHAQGRNFDQQGAFAAGCEFEWTKLPDVWEAEKLYDFSAKVRMTGDHPSTANYETASICYNQYPAGSIEVVVPPSRPAGPNPWRTISPGMVAVAWREGPPKESAGSISVKCKRGYKAGDSILISVEINQNTPGGEFDIYYRYDWKPGPTTPDQTKTPTGGTPPTGATTTKPPTTTTTTSQPPTTTTTNKPPTTTTTTTKQPKTPPDLVSSTPRPTDQGGPATLVADTVSAWNGELVWVSVKLVRAANLANMNFDVTYQPGAAEVVEVFKGEVVADRLFEVNCQEAGRARVGFAGPAGIGGTGRVMAIRFRATGAPGTVVPIRLAVREANSPAGTRTPIGTTDGAIWIRSASGQTGNGPGGGGPGGTGTGGGGGTGAGGTGTGGSGGGGPGGGGPGGGSGVWQPTPLDASRALKMSVKLLPVEMRYDVNKDGAVTARDATLILQQASEARQQ